MPFSAQNMSTFLKFVSLHAIAVEEESGADSGGVFGV